ncbi:hypothetical protein ACFL6W_08455 [Thermodesulfobacteriota bacterium]
MPSTLCFPDSEKSCFACCPPIRPPEYTHADYENIIKRTLRENSKDYNPDEKDLKPITGFSCWALGYVDAEYKKIGCLLHPQVNNGRDMRYRIDYGVKCMRESCTEEVVFSMMGEREKHFWLSLTAGMNSFEYSNRKTNLLFKMLNWGSSLLAKISDNDNEKYHSKKEFLKRYPFFDTGLLPRGHSFPVNHIIRTKSADLLAGIEFINKYEYFSKILSEKISSNFKMPHDGIFVHKLGINREFSDYIRLTLGVRKAEITFVNELYDFVLNELDLFCKKI